MQRSDSNLREGRACNHRRHVAQTRVETP